MAYPVRSTTRHLMSTLIALALIVGLAAPTFAQVSALRGHDTQQPIDVSANDGEVRAKEGWALLQGLVKIKQGRLTMTSDMMRVHYLKETVNDNPVIRMLDAKGKVVFTSPTETISAERAIYDVEKRLVTMVGDIRLTRGKTVLTGGRMELNLVTGLTKLYGADGKEKKGRVQGTFSLPKQKPDDTP